jgi:hypothetical protein
MAELKEAKDGDRMAIWPRLYSYGFDPMVPN